MKRQDIKVGKYYHVRYEYETVIKGIVLVVENKMHTQMFVVEWISYTGTEYNPPFSAYPERFIREVSKEELLMAMLE